MITAQVVLINKEGLILGVSRKDNHKGKLSIDEKVKITALQKGYKLYNVDEANKITETGKCVIKELIEKAKKAGIDTSMIKQNF